MQFNEEERAHCQAKLNKQAWPTKLYPFYVVYTLPWATNYPYAIGYDDEGTAKEVEAGYKAKGRDAGITHSFPFEHMHTIKEK
jgi:hypothetical protein